MLRDESVRVDASWCGVEAEAEAEAKTASGHGERCASVHRRLKRIVKARGALDAQEAEALREAERLRVWRHYGYASLIEYMEMEMGYSPRAALERLRVAKAIVELPVIAEALTQGELSFSAARELTRVVTPDTEQAWLDAVNDKNLREVESLVAAHERGDSPDDPVAPNRRKRTLRFEELDEETVAMIRQARQILERECGERLDDNAVMRTFARLVIDGARAPERTRAPYQIAVSTCPQCKRGRQDGGGITVEMSAAMLEAAQCDAQHIGSVEHDEAAAADRATANLDATRVPAAEQALAKENGKRTRARTNIPPALRRKVSARDHGRCRVPWCRSSRNIDQHHVVPVSEGGAHTLDNLITLCESHHLALHEGSLILEGNASSARFARRAHGGSFAAAQHAVETAAALRTLGFDKAEVKAAIARTRTHVGTADVPLEEWIRIALTYCPKPVGSTPR